MDYTIEKQYVQPYTFLAPYYDSMMRHVSYGEWADFYEKIFKKFGLPVFDICELACGTGSLAIELYQRGYNMTCSDRSAEMIEVARKKSNRLALGIPFMTENMLSYSRKNHFDAVICAYDSVNYLLAMEEVEKYFEHVSRLLKPRGIFIFDISTEYNSLVNFSRTYEWDPKRRFKRYGFFDEQQRIQHNIIEIEIDGRIYCEEHQQRIYPFTEIFTHIHTGVWDIIGSFGDFTLFPVNEQSERAHFVLQKK